MKLSDDEALLYLAVECVPKKTIQQYSTGLKLSAIKAMHAVFTLKRFGCIAENADGTFSSVHIEPEQSSPDEQNDTTDKMQKAEESVNDGEIEMAQPRRGKPTEESLLEDIRGFFPSGKSSSFLAELYGETHHAVNWKLKALIKQGKIVKRAEKFYLAEKQDECVQVAVPEAPVKPASEPLPTYNNPVSYNGNVRVQPEPRHSHILTIEIKLKGKKGEFTFAEAKEEFAGDYDEGAFEKAFEQMLKNKYFNARELTDTDYRYTIYGEKVDPELVYSVCEPRTDYECSKAIEACMDRLKKQNYTLHEIVRETRLRHDLIVQYFQARMRYQYDDDNETVRVKGYSIINDLTAEDILVFVDTGVPVKAFIKRFNLDPADTEQSVKILVNAGVVKHDSASNYIYPKSQTAEKAVEPAPVIEEAPVEVEIVQESGCEGTVGLACDVLAKPATSVEIIKLAEAHIVQPGTVDISAEPHVIPLVVPAETVKEQQAEIVVDVNHEAELQQKEDAHLKRLEDILSRPEEMQGPIGHVPANYPDFQISEDAFLKRLENDPALKDFLNSLHTVLSKVDLNEGKIMSNEHPGVPADSSEQLPLNCERTVPESWLVTLELLAKVHSKDKTTKRILKQIREYLQ